MALLRLSALRCARRAAATTTKTTTATATTTAPMGLASRALSTTAKRQGGGHGNESHWDSPGGWLWGIKPGEKPEAEGWEWPMYIFCGSLVATGIAFAFKPDTSVSTWALEEARRRLEAQGVLPDPEQKKD